MAPRYNDEDFLEHIPLDPDTSRSTNAIANAVGCTWETANRRLTKIVEETGALEAHDPYRDTDYNEETNTGRLLVYRASPEFLQENNIHPDD